MSRVGKLPVAIPAGVSVSIADNIVTVKGSKGTLTQALRDEVVVEVKDNEVVVTRKNDEKTSRSFHGLYRQLIANMIKGVSEGYSKVLLINGVGYRATLQGNKVVLNVGYSHQVELEVPAGLKVELPKNTVINISGIDKQLVGQFAAEIREVRKPEPYKGKGIKYSDEHIRRKEGKTAKK